jgi:hypothetical protein
MTPIRHQPRALAVYCVVAVFGLLTGCGAGDGQRLPVTGRITGNGAETLDGAISFIPAKGNEGLGATCALKNGVYQFDRSNGPTAGHHQVSIRRTPSKPTGRPAAGQTRQEWIFQADVPAKGPYTIDLKLD